MKSNLILLIHNKLMINLSSCTLAWGCPTDDSWAACSLRVDKLQSPGLLPLLLPSSLLLLLPAPLPGSRAMQHRSARGAKGEPGAMLGVRGSSGGRGAQCNSKGGHRHVVQQRGGSVMWHAAI